MFNYFDQSPENQKELLEASAFQMKVDPVIIEKDLWVVLTLHALFDQLHDYNQLKDPGLIFKGGTSLSKAYQIIERFSEDRVQRKHGGYL